MVGCNMECPGHTCIHWTNNNLTHLCHSVDDITCRRFRRLPELWVRCRASEAKMEGPNSRPPQSSYHPSSFPPPPAIATEPHQISVSATPPPLHTSVESDSPPLSSPPLLPPPPMLTSPGSPPPLHSNLHTPPAHTPHSPLLPHTPITPLPHTPLTPHSPLTPLTSQSTLASEASVDSGVASAQSLDLLHNSSLETHALRKRAGSSISSGTSDVGLGSLDGDPAGLEVLPELWPTSENPSTESAPQPALPVTPVTSGSPPTELRQTPSSPHQVLLCNASYSGTTPSSPYKSPVPSCPSPSFKDHCDSSPLSSVSAMHHLLPQSTEVSVEGLESDTSLSAAVDVDLAWRVSSPEEKKLQHFRLHRHHHLPKEAFSSVIPFHPSALKSHHLGHVWPSSESDGKIEKEETNVLTDTNALFLSKCADECLLRSEQSLTNFSSNEALCERESFFRSNESLIRDTYNVNCVIMPSKEMPSVNSYNRITVDRMTREGCVWIDKFASLFVKQILEEALAVSCSLGWSIKCSGQCQREQCREEYQKKENCWWVGSGGGKSSSRKSSIPLLGLSCGSPGLCWTPELPYSPSHRPHSRSSLGSSLSFSHDSLVSSGPRMDDSHLITGAVSHDALLFPTSKTPHSDVSDIYNVPLDGDIYAVPVDVVKPKEGQILHPKAIMLQPKKRHYRRHAKHSTSGSSSVYTDGGSKKMSGSNSNDHTASSGSKQLKESSSSVSRSRQHSGQSVGSGSGDILRASKRHSVPSNIGCVTSTTPKHGASKDSREPIHMTLEEVRKSFHESDDTINCNKNHRIQQETKAIPEQSKICRIIPFTSMKSCKRKEHSEGRAEDNRKRGRSLSSNIRNTLITIFGLKRGSKSGSPRLKSGSSVEASSQGFANIVGNGVTTTPTSCSPTSGPQQSLQNQSTNTTTLNKNHHNQHNHHGNRHSNGINTGLLSCLGNHRTDPDDVIVPIQAAVANNVPSRSPAVVTNRALPPLPLPAAGDRDGDDNTAQNGNISERREEEGCDFASIIEKVKDCGWYWGPISGEAAEKVLANEPDGSFIVRDSSDHHYIFSLTFKLNGFIRHVRIEHDQGSVLPSQCFLGAQT
ncbi:hypothetical protein SK128_016463 [Halocaridina rubra]|uniref:SH2 domain-containing protein n=1 Tax=Halocaridina rubra TaxID=373956 RepID=A0AAN8WW70_HALRR